MLYKIVVDSCCDWPENIDDRDICRIPLTLSLDGKEYVDNETFNQKEFLEAVANSKNCPKSACPSPQMYYEAYEGEYDCVFVVNLSSKLSGSYQSAVVAQNMYYDDNNNDKNIYIFDSKTACGGQALIAMKIRELADKDLSFEEIVRTVEDYIYELDTYFVIDTLDTLKKNGRLTGVTALMADILNIKPIMGADDGEIIKLDQARGMARSLKKMTDIVVNRVKDAKEKYCVITHCNCEKRALEVKEMLLNKGNFREILIAKTGGISTCYANDGGIVVHV